MARRSERWNWKIENQVKNGFCNAKKFALYSEGSLRYSGYREKNSSLGIWVNIIPFYWDKKQKEGQFLEERDVLNLEHINSEAIWK